MFGQRAVSRCPKERYITTYDDSILFYLFFKAQKHKLLNKQHPLSLDPHIATGTLMGQGKKEEQERTNFILV